MATLWNLGHFLPNQPMAIMSSLSMKHSPEHLTSFMGDTFILAYIEHISAYNLTKYFYLPNFRYVGLHLSCQIEKTTLWNLGHFLPNQPMAIMSSLSKKHSPEHLTSFMGDAFILAYIEHISAYNLTKYFYLHNFRYVGLHLYCQIEMATLWNLGHFLPNQPMVIMSSLSMKHSPEHLTSFMGDTFILAYIEHISAYNLTKYFYLHNFRYVGLHLSCQIEKMTLWTLGHFLPNQLMVIMSSLSMKHSPEHLTSFMGDAFILAYIEYISG